MRTTATWILLSIFLLLTYVTKGQKVVIVDTSFYKYSDSKLSLFDDHQKFIGELGLKDLRTSKDFFVLRWIPAGCIFELTVDSLGNKNSTYLNYSWKYNKKKFKDGELLTRFNSLPDDTIEAIYKMLKSTQIDSLMMTDRKKWVKEWKGNSNIFEVSTNGVYKFIMFNQTVPVDGIDFMGPLGEFSQINDFILFVEEKIQYWGTLMKFEKSLPAGKYSNGFNTFWNYD